MIEVLIVLVVGAVVVAGLAYVLSSSRRTSRIADLESQAQQNARVTIDFVSKDLRSAGYEVDQGNGQSVVVHGGPFELVFNANVAPEPDEASVPGYPSAININASPATVPPSGTLLYAPAMTYETGAETFRFTLDSTNDGVIDASDGGDESVEGTPNPYDYMLLRQLYGYDGSSNGGANEPIALIRGPDPYGDGTYPHPLFTYWYDHDDDPATADILWGDGSGNGELEQGEIAGLTQVSQANLIRITRIGITATGISRVPDSRHTPNEGYREVVITSEVSVRRSRPSTASYIRGAVYDDFNGDGDRQGGEPGIADVTVRLNTGATRTTSSNGNYVFRVDPGAYTVSEIDPVGYTSTTPNAVVVNVTRGGVATVDFGDRAIAGYGGILGKVILYEDEGTGPEPTEYVVPGVEIFLNTGERDTTDNLGRYSFIVPVSTYSITMGVPMGYLAVGPTTVDRALGGTGDTVMVDFGLMLAENTGTITGVVFEDEPVGNGPPNGMYDPGESGIVSVTVRLSSGDSTLTDADGIYSFTVVAGTYDVTEEDLGGYISTTPNNVTGVVVEADSTVVVNFGDMFVSEIAFTVITLGETQRALSIASTDLQEFKDPAGHSDQEIILGTKYVSGVSNLNVWKNEWATQSTPNTDIFAQDPWYSRSPTEDIFSVAPGDVSGDGVNDVISGLTSASGKTLIWFTQTTGNKAGQLSDTPDGFFISTGIADVLEALLVNVDADGDLDALIGTEYMPDAGRFEVWFNDGSGSFSHNPSDVYETVGPRLLGAVRSIAVANVGGSPALDAVVGTAVGIGRGVVEIFRDNGGPTGQFVYFTTIEATGEVNAVALADMHEDSDDDIDIIVGTKTGVGTGWVELWHNNSDGTFGVADGFGGYEPSDTVRMSGEVLCLGVDDLDRDIYPDVVVGLKNAASYSGEVQIFQTFGYLPSASTWDSPDIGEVITLTINDFNNDFRQDFAVGTRTSLSHGHVVVFFNETQ
jgi:type II secretory pathway pseudopilin PulG